MTNDTDTVRNVDQAQSALQRLEREHAALKADVAELRELADRVVTKMAEQGMTA